MTQVARRAAWVWAVLLLAGAAGVGISWAVDPNALWTIVHDRCMPDELAHHEPAPCAAVDIADGVDRGWAILKDLVGQTQFLLIPTARLSGIESPELLDAAAPNYWQEAWDARTFVQQRAPAPLSRDDIGLAINAASARSQNQLHIHIDCVRADVRDALRARQAQIGDSWSTIELAGQTFSVRRIEQPELGAINPFKLVAREVVSGGVGMAAETIVVVGARLNADAGGFFVLASRADSGTANRGHGEDLLDHECAVARHGP